MSRLFIRGYCDRPSVRPGEKLNFYVSTDEPTEYQAELVRLGVAASDGVERRSDDVHSDYLTFEPTASILNGTHRAGPQRTQIGGYIEVPDSGGLLVGEQGLSVHAFVWATLPDRDQAIISRWDEKRRAGWALTIEDGYLTFTVGGGAGAEARVRSDHRLFPEVFYSVVAGFDPSTGELFLEQRVVLNRFNSRIGYVVPLESDASATSSGQIEVVDAHVPVILAGATEEVLDGRAWVSRNFNGKIDSPKVFQGSLSREAVDALHAGGSAEGAKLLAHWDFTRETTKAGVATDAITDVSGSGLNGTCFNQPDRVMTGWNWEGVEENYLHAPEQ